MRYPFSLWLAAGALAATLQAGAAPADYGTERGWGSLTLDRAARTFAISTVGANAHTCELQGRLSGAKLNEGTADSCRITLTEGRDGRIIVAATQATEEACRQFCGMRAYFDGDYLPLPAACRPDALRQQHARGLADYRAKRFDAALQTWGAGLAACERLMNRFGVWGWRNDMAIAAHRLGRHADCIQWSQAVLDEAAPIDFPPTDADTAAPLLKAARFNLGQCRQAR